MNTGGTINKIDNCVNYTTGQLLCHKQYYVLSRWSGLSFSPQKSFILKNLFLSKCEIYPGLVFAYRKGVDFVLGLELSSSKWLESKTHKQLEIMLSI